MLSSALSIGAFADLSSYGAKTSSIAVTLSDPSAVCLDGSPFKYYISRGSNPKGFYIYHQGGGWCQTVEECFQRSSTTLGSSKTYPAEKDLTDSTVQTHIFFNRDAKVNPLMHDWTYVWLPYCDGGSFAGSNQTSYDRKTIHFRGTNIRKALIEDLKKTAAFGKATDLVVSGCSAGGAATYMHLDWYASQVPLAKTRGIPDSGWFLDGNYARDGKTDYDSRMKSMFTMINATSGLASNCVAANGFKCLFADTAIGYIKTPIFALNSRFDASMADGTYGNGAAVYKCTSYTAKDCDAASVNIFGNFIEKEMKRLLKPPHGAFLDSCFRHCSINCPAYDIDIKGVRAAQAVHNWYHNGSAAMSNGGFFDQGSAFPCANCCK